jgi:transcriptional regulator with XRE-family HTH domain
MSLTDAIARLAAARGMTPAEVADSGRRTPSALYRILSGQTTDPRTSTLLELCQTLRTSPGELLGLAGLVEPAASEVTTIDVALRQAFREVQALAEDDRVLVLALVRSFVQERGPKASARPQRSARAEPAAGRGGGTG